jgi:hypothetical protein
MYGAMAMNVKKQSRAFADLSEFNEIIRSLKRVAPGLSPMRKFRLNRDQDEPANGPNFPIAGDLPTTAGSKSETLVSKCVILGEPNA